MLKLDIPARKEEKVWDEEREIFLTKPAFCGAVLNLEHSLISISKWESQYHKPFLVDDQKTEEELTSYFRCMCVDKGIDPLVFYEITDKQKKEIMDYINDPMTATWFSEDKKGGKAGKKSSEIITNELVYYWMIHYNIPDSYERWHLNHLLTLIRICSIKEEEANGKEGKKNPKADAQANSSIMKARREAAKAKHH